MSVLIVVSHPDDEVLGCGGTGAALAARGIPVRACILSGNVEVRGARPQDDELRADILAAQKTLGFGEPILGGFPNIRLNTVAQVELVQFIEKAMIATAADIIFTHHPGDLNDDHLQTARACQAAARLAQRRPGLPPLKRLYFMEILSATDWSFRGGSAVFEPDAYFDVSATMDLKLAALTAYRGVMRPAPHPRSVEVLRGHAAFRGGQSGLHAAEAFQTAFTLLRGPDFE
jgi:LmbE family N-acetylglucosaminyl deacetylase